VAKTAAYIIPRGILVVIVVVVVVVVVVVRIMFLLS